jgi:branched-chain amino acid transport system ATP-binding protein
MSSGGARLRVQDLCSGYGRVAVLRDVSLDVPAGQVVALLGPNGAGKTTLLRSIFGLADVTAGSIEFDGTPVTHRAPHLLSRAGLCYVTEGRAIHRSLTVRENLALFAGGRITRTDLEEVCTLFPILRDRLKQYAGTMSGGQQQMVALARAVLSRPRMILADELSLGLAPVAVDEIFDVLARLKSELGVSMVLVEQYAERALALADTAYVLNRGEVAFCGESDELRGSPELVSLYLGSSEPAPEVPAPTVPATKRFNGS